MDLLNEGGCADGALERGRIQAFRWTIYVFILPLTLYLSGVSLHWFERPRRPMRLALRPLLAALWLLYGFGLCWSQRLDRRLKG
jgi:hypothetical protein